MRLLKDKHVQFIKALDTKQDELEYWFTEHLRVAGLYWGLVSLELLGKPEELPTDEVVKFVLSCQDPKTSGFGAHKDHDPHIMYTLYSLQILLMKGHLEKVDKDAVADYIISLQLEDGSVQGDNWGEIDTRFLYIAVQALSILGKLGKRGEGKKSFDTEKAALYLQKCQNFDGGFGQAPGGESHSAMVFVCVAALNILKRMDLVNQELLSWWLCERQTEAGGLNGRPEKLPDVCYSWWVVASMAILGRLDWIDGDRLREFILSAQDDENGGIADRQDDEPDVFHTVFGLCGLSLLGYDELLPVNATYCLPERVMHLIPDFNSPQ